MTARGLTVACLVFLTTHPLALAQAGTPRQYYSRYWEKSPQGSYYYKTFYFKARPTDVNYHYHRVVYYPDLPRYLYYFNPYTRKYWGRFDRVRGGYAILKPEDQGEKLSDIPDDRFLPPDKMPFLPEMKSVPREGAPLEPLALNQVRMEKPDANDLPPDESASAARPKTARPRQFYSGWCKQGGYFYSSYFYQPAPGEPYQYHRCIFYPRQPRYIYYYNPQKRKYWGRFDLRAKGYSLLAEKDRAEVLADIPATAFPMPAAMPPIPGSADKTPMAAPTMALPIDS